MNSQCYNNILQHVTLDGKELCFDGCPLHDTLATGKVNQADVFLHHKDGHRVPVTVKTMPLKDDKGNIVAAIEVFTDSIFKEETYSENRELKEMLIMDTLTQVPNRRYLDFHLENMKNENGQFGTKFGVLFLDIDLFKNVNDIHGHNIGDEVLKMVARTLKLNIRNDDKVGRWGGEEFIAVLTCKGNRALAVIAEKLRLLVQKSNFKSPDDILIKVTISVGGTMYKPGEEIIDLIDRADKNMYDAKQTGRNKTTIK